MVPLYKQMRLLGLPAHMSRYGIKNVNNVGSLLTFEEAAV